MKRKSFIGVLIVLLLVLTSCGVKQDDSSALNAQKVSVLMAQSMNRSNAYNGIIVAQQTKEINKDSNKVVKEVLVKQGDGVKADTVLFTYDTDLMAVETQKAALEIERMNNEIINAQSQINNLVTERNNAPASQQLSYTIEIQTLQATISETNYNIKSKQVEYERLQASLENASVTAGIDGIVQNISPEGTDPMGNPSAYMTILQTGNYRVKGNVNEMNIASIQPQIPVLIRSRIDQTKTWPGVIDVIETNSPTQSSPNMGMPSDQMGQSSSYPFYVQLTETEGLFLGQHVYIELDMGQGAVKEGVWLLPNYVFFTPEGETKVWKADDNKKLELVSVSIGEVDGMSGQMQILEGITLDDYVVEALENLKEGQSVNVLDGGQ